jgi:hypothetical protein
MPRRNGHDNNGVAIAVGGDDDELELLNAGQIAKLFNLKPDWVLRHAREPRRSKNKNAPRRSGPPPIPSIKLGRYVRFQEAAVRDWLDELKRNYPNTRH